MHPTPTHPSWCEYPNAPNDATHTHTAAVGTAYLARDAIVELVLVQTSDSLQPMLTMHVTAPTARLSIDITGVQAWALAGVLMDGTVRHAHASSSSWGVEAAPADPPVPLRAKRRARPMWLLDQHPNGRMAPPRSVRWAFCCPPHIQAGGDDCDRDDDGVGG